jgi:hypothetical protein
MPVRGSVVSTDANNLYLNFCPTRCFLSETQFADRVIFALLAKPPNPRRTHEGIRAWLCHHTRDSSLASGFTFSQVTHRRLEIYRRKAAFDAQVVARFIARL